VLKAKITIIWRLIEKGKDKPIEIQTEIKEKGPLIIKQIISKDNKLVPNLNNFKDLHQRNKSIH
jgi:hypothetical protein